MGKSGSNPRRLWIVGFLLLVLAVLPLTGLAETVASGNGEAGEAAPAAQDSVNEAELAQLLAPIALYPDTLLAQMFMASTYPLEIVEAARFVQKQPELKDEALEKALENKDWDESVKSLCHFPSVLKSMNDNLEATKKLGDFVLADQKAVMDMVQTLRAKAHEKGELKTTKEQKVVVKEKTIIIEPANPEVVYVPSYSTTVVYGPWWYPSYPPVVWYPPPPVFAFTAGVAVGVWASHWCRPNWGRGEIDIDINRNININRPHRPGGGRPRDRMARAQAWKHNPKHRKGVAYRNRDVRKRYGQSVRTARQRDLARGYGSRGLDRRTRDSIKKQGLKTNGKFGQGFGNRQNRQATRPASGKRPNRAVSSGNRNRMTRSNRASSASRIGQTRASGVSRASYNRSRRSNSAFRRSGSASSARHSSMRGRSSRSFSRARAGGGRRR
ncbi:MAG: DUF3300 domain-containing protein [Deltaproteobacteria bacterium]|nr:DUF3300 domain-containing protein [Deltaproteobacteria bacterium]